MTVKKTIIALGAAASLAGGGVIIADNSINPYTDKADRYELSVDSVLKDSGKSKIYALKAEPKVVFEKWGGEIAMGVKYENVKGTGDRAFLTNKLEWKDAKEEVHAYPLQATSSMEDGGFEIEVVLNEKPTSNKFDFTIDGADQLDFFYQPALTQAEIDEGNSRPDNVVGSYAVYHKTKANHRVGDTNYATGKAYHIYRPKAIDANGVEEWAELNYENGVLSVIVPQKFLDDAVYPVRVDPTFGYTTAGTTLEGADDQNYLMGSAFTAPESGTVTSITSYQLKFGSNNEQFKGVILLNSDLTIIADGTTPASGIVLGAPTWNTVSYSSQPTLTASTVYIIAYVYTLRFLSPYYDTGSSNQGCFDSTNSYATPANMGSCTRSTKKYSIYATYTAAAVASINPSVIIKGNTIIKGQMIVK